MRNELIERFHAWLGESGLNFFREVKAEFGTVCAVLPSGHKLGVEGMPWSIHFREGMQIRNWLRGQPECKEWTAHEYNDRWTDLVEKALEYAS